MKSTEKITLNISVSLGLCKAKVHTSGRGGLGYHKKI